MDFSAWSQSHTIIAIFAAVGFIGQVAVLFYRTAQLEKRIESKAKIGVSKAKHSFTQ